MTTTLELADDAFVLETDDSALARRLREAEGWGRTTRGGLLPHGRHGLYTREPHAALNAVRWAPEGTLARERLLPMLAEYRASLAEECDARLDVPPGAELMPFQRAGVRYALDRQNCLIGDDMGLGKTAQAVVVANELRAERILVVCPGSVRLQWQGEVRYWTTMRRPSTYPVLKSADGVSPSANWTFISYDLTRNDALRAALERLRFDLLILDEAHYLKTVDSLRTRAAFGDLLGETDGLRARAERVLALTGTPLPNRPRECYTLFRHMAWDAIDWMSEEAFNRRFNPSVRLWTGAAWEEVGRLPELRARLRCNLMVRRRKRRVLKQLPRMQFELTYVEPNGAIRRALRAEQALDIDLDDLENLDMETRGHVATVRREMGVAKVPRVVEHVRMVLSGGVEKLFVVAFHREVLSLLEDRLARYGVAVIRGGQTPGRREREKRRFMDDPGCRVCLGQLQAAGEGLDGLQRATWHGVAAEFSWTPKDNEQFVGRLDRLGQTRGAFWQFLVAPDSYDERIFGRAVGKLENIHETLDAE